MPRFPQDDLLLSFAVRAVCVLVQHDVSAHGDFEMFDELVKVALAMVTFPLRHVHALSRRLIHLLADPAEAEHSLAQVQCQYPSRHLSLELFCFLDACHVLRGCGDLCDVNVGCADDDLVKVKKKKWLNVSGRKFLQLSAGHS